ncbi:hypothetical protein [Serratia marcescens]|uniref:hypothetical protein n=1 Tax=Serratia marcescens TaxID=615 RepID=UPI00111BDE37|nr:hypothetical protein [Serratia marcescens]MBH3333678.1 hypothetical protein [Serratia marcescens]MCF1610147.1 hypothetical protein [Serratia marcescens]UJA56149.1 hypothetical protein L1F17_09740 [Serratia marcescens]HEI8820182.1 hypothetical protein [Serratia marcescens]
MSSDTTEVMFKKITPQILANYLKEKRVSDVCPACGSTDRTTPLMHVEYRGPTILTSKAHDYVAIYQSPSLVDKRMPGISSFAVVCGNCGHTSFFNAWKLLNWFRENYPAESNDEN